MTPDAAQSLTAEIRSQLELIAGSRDAVLPLIREAAETRAHEALGYKSWSAYVSTEFGSLLGRLQTQDRQPLVQQMAALGMSTRAIAPVVGTSHTTVERDLSGGTDVPPGTREVHGRDGKGYTVRPRPAPDPAMLADSERRAAISNLNSCLIYLTSEVLTPTQLAAEYTAALDEFKQDALDFAAATMCAIATLKQES